MQDWHVHVEQMHQNQEMIDTSLKETKTQLNKLYDDIVKTMEKISSREKYINSQLETMLSDFRKQQDKLTETKEKYRQCSGGVTEKSRKLAEVLIMCRGAMCCNIYFRLEGHYERLATFLCKYSNISLYEDNIYCPSH